MLSACTAGCLSVWVRAVACFGDKQQQSTGPHKCVGYKLAMMEAVLCVAALCLRYRFALPEGVDGNSPALKMGVTLVPKEGVWLRVSQSRASRC